jgi:hypothetical protein
MLKILYAASNSESAKIQLARFMKAIEGKPYIVKVAAYKKSSPKINIDWTLNCLLNIYKPDHISLENDNFQIYFEQVKYFAPDLIISDLEYFTSYIANVLDIALWQCSSSLINYAVSNEEKYNIGLFKHYSFLSNRNPIHTQRITNIIDNSNCNFVYSHLGDIPSPPTLKDNFEWIRPYHSLGKVAVPCRHNVVAATLDNDKKILSLLKRYSDSVVFTNFYQEYYSNILMKDIEKDTEYACNLKNSNMFMCEGQTSFLADAFYNGKHAVILTDFKDLECIVNSTFSERYKLGTPIYSVTEELEPYMGLEVQSLYQENIKLLHERIEEL